MPTVLYISYDGMTDPLGQSQVLPYLIGLSKRGYQLVLISFEKAEKYPETKATIESICAKANIIWKPLIYTKNPPILSTLWDVYRMKKTILSLQRKYHFSHTHCRSHIAAIGGDYLYRKFNVPYIFDMRGFYADERVDGNIWKLSNPIFKKVYAFFKAKERHFLMHAKATISLTEAGKKIIHQWPGFESVPIEVIPCCADLSHFDYQHIASAEVDQWRKKLKIEKSDVVISYLGSLGTWYLADEMFQFFNQLQHQYPGAKFLLITPDSADYVFEIAKKQHISPSAIVVQKAKRAEVPALLSLSNISLFFIKPVFSKQASSPVKMGEILAMGIPVIANSGVGDVDSIIEDTHCGIRINTFSERDYTKGIQAIPALLTLDKSIFRNAAEKYYSLEKGIEIYAKIYEQISQNQF